MRLRDLHAVQQKTVGNLTSLMNAIACMMMTDVDEISRLKMPGGKTRDPDKF
jgi:hypothetical protein